MSWLCADCALPDPYHGDGDGIGSCECPRCEDCGSAPGTCDCAARAEWDCEYGQDFPEGW